MVTVIVEVHNLNKFEGTESLTYTVANRPHPESWEESRFKEFSDEYEANKYAEYLHDRYKTEDIVNIEA